MKDFDKWNSEKKKIDNDLFTGFYYPREIWWCSLGINVGLEQDGEHNKFQRPVLIVKGFSKNTCLIAPLTTSDSENKYRVGIGLVAGRTCKVILSQLKTVDVRRFSKKIGVLDKKIFMDIKKHIRDML